MQQIWDSQCIEKGVPKELSLRNAQLCTAWTLTEPQTVSFASFAAGTVFMSTNVA